MIIRLAYSAHFDPKPVLCAHHTVEYGSLTVLGFEPNCARLGESLVVVLTQKESNQ